MPTTTYERPSNTINSPLNIHLSAAPAHLLGTSGTHIDHSVSGLA
jgi:hypothetical protein